MVVTAEKTCPTPPPTVKNVNPLEALKAKLARGFVESSSNGQLRAGLETARPSPVVSPTNPALEALRSKLHENLCAAVAQSPPSVESMKVAFAQGLARTARSGELGSRLAMLPPQELEVDIDVARVKAKENLMKSLKNGMLDTFLANHCRAELAKKEEAAATEVRCAGSPCNAIRALARKSAAGLPEKQAIEVKAPPQKIPQPPKYAPQPPAASASPKRPSFRRGGR